MKRRHWLLILALGGAAAIAVPPLFLRYYDGPRHFRTAEGLWAVAMRHDGEQSIEVSSLPPGAAPTRSQLAAAWELQSRSAAAAAAWQDYDFASTTGGFSVSNAMVLHRPEADFYHLFSPANMTDGVVLDPSRPESLVYAHVGSGFQLVGVMFMARPGEHGTQLGGPLTRWHYHPVVEFCMDSAGVPTVEAARGVDGGCPTGQFNGPTPEMLHVWLIDNPRGVFAHQMAMPDDHAAMHGTPPNPYREFGRRVRLKIRDVL